MKTSQRRQAQRRRKRAADMSSAPAGVYAADAVTGWQPATGRHRKKLYTGRFYLVFFLLLLVALGIIGKLLYIQVWDAEHLKKMARESRTQSLSLFNRGRILDRNGITLAQDTFVYDVYAHPRYFFGMPRQNIARTLAPVLGKPVAEVSRKLAEPFTTIALAKNVKKDLVDRIQSARIVVPAKDQKTGEPLRDDDGRVIYKKVKVPGLDFSKKPVRNYPQGGLAAHVLGYINDEARISYGVEYSARHALKQVSLDRNLLLTGRGDYIHFDQESPESLVSIPQAKNVTLTLDSKLQYIAERELAEGLKRTQAKRGTVLMMDPRNGEILAFASLPAYLPDQFYKASAEELKNWAMTDVYPPGSTFKILTVACGLESGVIREDSKIQDTGRMKIGGWTITNYDYNKRGAPGMIDLVYLLMHSSNIGSAKISMMIPQKTHARLLRAFGIGHKTGIDLPGESAGIFDDRSSWGASTHASLGYGYGLASTPLQMAAAVAAIANGGVWNTPHVLRTEKHLVHRRVLSPETAATTTRLLAESINNNKTASVRLEGINVAGKTGTSRKPSASGRGYSNELYTSFIGYFPAERPEVLVAVVIDSPHMAESWGSTVAGPIFRAIATETVSYLGLKPVTIASTAAPATTAGTSTTAR
ncbi:MAG: peptidoglycan D,D-transpeptidase FtsI family protein [Candidatus Melainabacteria bacterium]